MKRILIYIIIFFGLIFQVFSANYIVKCDIPEHFFVQDFTCLNADCSIRLDRVTGLNDVVEIGFNGENITTIGKSSFNLEIFENNLDVITKLCDVRVSNLVYNKFNLVLKENSQKFEDDFLIESYSDENIEFFSNKREISSKNYNDCYLDDFEIVGEWIFEKKSLKSYCYLDKNQKPQISQFKFLSYLLFSPNIYSFYYLILIGVFVLVFYFIFRLKTKIYHRGEFEDFFRINSEKKKYFMILLLPFLFLWGIFFNYLLIDNYSFLFKYYTFIILLGFMFLYYLVCLLDYLKK